MWLICKLIYFLICLLTLPKSASSHTFYQINIAMIMLGSLRACRSFLINYLVDISHTHTYHCTFDLNDLCMGQLNRCVSQLVSYSINCNNLCLEIRKLRLVGQNNVTTEDFYDPSRRKHLGTMRPIDWKCMDSNIIEF